MRNGSPGKPQTGTPTKGAHWGTRILIVSIWLLVIAMSCAGAPPPGAALAGLIIGDIGFSLAMFFLFRHA